MCAPAEWPISTIRCGSPPNSCACCCTQATAWRGIVEKAREFYFGIEPIVGKHGDVAAVGQRGADEPIVRLAASLPRAAVPEDHHRTRRRPFRLRDVDVELLARIAPIRDVGRALERAERGRRVGNAKRDGGTSGQQHPQSP